MINLKRSFILYTKKGADILKQWDATLDKKTRKAHRLLDEPFEINGHKAMYPSNFGIPSLDINCRCAILQRTK